MARNDSMFLDTVRIAIPLLRPMKSVSFPFGDKAHWKKITRAYCTEYVFVAPKMFWDDLCEYIPRLTYATVLTKYGLRDEIRMEFSIPKLLYQNNFLNADKSELEHVMERVTDVLNYIYHFEEVKIEDVERATVMRIDCGTIAFLPNVEVYNMACSRIYSARMDKRIDIDAPNYSEKANGIVVKCNSWELVFYNKNEELRRYCSSYRKAKFEENDSIMIANGFLQELDKTEVVAMRCELRLVNKRNINSALARINEDGRQLTLQNLLEHDIPRRLLQCYWLQVVEGLPRYDMLSASEEDVFNVLSSQGGTLKQLTEKMGLVTLSNLPNQHRLREAVENRSGRTGWNRFKKKLEALPEFPREKDPIAYISDAIFGRITYKYPARLSAISITSRKCIIFYIPGAIIPRNDLRLFCWANCCSALLHYILKQRPPPVLSIFSKISIYDIIKEYHFDNISKTKVFFWPI